MENVLQGSLTMDQLKQAAVLALLLLVVIRNTKATQTVRVNHFN